MTQTATTIEVSPVSAHTPGPWELVRLNGRGPFAIRMKYSDEQTYYGVNTIHREADARLIAAAPDLIAKADALLERLFRSHLPSDGALPYASEEWEDARAKADDLRVCIAKATGGA